MTASEEVALLDIESSKIKLDSIENRLKSEMQKLEGQIDRFQEIIDNYSQKIDKADKKIKRKSFSSGRCLLEDLSKGNNLNVTFDVKDYSSDEISVKIEDGQLIVCAKSGETDKGFTYRIMLPEGTKSDHIKQSLSGDGKLTIEGKLPSVIKS